MPKLPSDATAKTSTPTTDTTTTSATTTDTTMSPATMDTTTTSVTTTDTTTSAATMNAATTTSTPNTGRIFKKSSTNTNPTIDNFEFPWKGRGSKKFEESHYDTKKKFLYGKVQHNNY